MEFVFLTGPEVEGAAIRWDSGAVKSPEFVHAALAAGFTEQEIEFSPVGILTADFPSGPCPMFRCGAKTLVGMNGCTLVQIR